MLILNCKLHIANNAELQKWIESKVNFWVQSFHKQICDAMYIDEKFRYISVPKMTLPFDCL